MPKPIRLGIFIFTTLLVFGGGIFWIGSREFRFTSTYRLNADFPNVAGLGEGATVRVGGIHEGTVRRILLPQRPDQKVRVEMDLKEATRNVVKKDSLAAIHTEGLVGDQFVEISFGSAGAEKVNDGDTLATEPPMQISDMLKKTNAILDSAHGVVESIDRTAENLQTISSKLNTGTGTAGALINDRSVYEHVNQAVANLQEDTEALKHNFLLRGFFKKRGYEDRTELSRHAIAQLPAAMPANQFRFRASKLFDKDDTAKLKNGKLLDEAGRYLEQNPYGAVVVSSYADQKGDSDQQTILSQARAAVARDYLVQRFRLDDSRIKTFAAGKSPDAPEGGEVRIVIYPPETPTQSGSSGRPTPDAARRK